MSIIVKNKKTDKKINSTITIKTTVDFKTKWDLWCIENNVNKKQTLEVVLTKLMNGEIK